MGRFETLPWLAARSPTCGLAQVPSADLDIPILGQLAPSQLPFGDALDQGSEDSTLALHRQLGPVLADFCGPRDLSLLH